MEIMSVAKQINDRIKRLEELASELEKVGDDKADAMRIYAIEFAKAMARLTRGKLSQIDGEPLPDNMPATVVKEYAKAVCAREMADVEIATNKYKSLITKIEALEASLNGKQSIFRHLSHEVR